jgi:hypothetical protein
MAHIPGGNPTIRPGGHLLCWVKMKMPQRRLPIEDLPERAWQAVLDFARRGWGSSRIFRFFLAPNPPKKVESKQSSQKDPVERGISATEYNPPF